MTKNELKLNRRSFLITASQLAAIAAFDPMAGHAVLINSNASPDSPQGSRRLYSIRHLSEKELGQTYELLLKEACSKEASAWKTADFDTSAGFWGDGVSDGNGGIRTIASMMLACAALIRYAQLDDRMRDDLIAQCRAAIRFTTATHRTGPAHCPDGKQWGATTGFGPGSWQSGMWTGTLAWASWLIWDRLDSDLHQGLERVIAWECDILSHRPPPNGLWGDTKAEENGWEVPCLAMGVLMFPSHPHASDWQRTVSFYLMNTLCTEADTRDTSLVDGRPVNEWVKGANLQPDYTLENHNIFHPTYVGCSSYFLTQAVMYYTYTRRPVPQAAMHHLMDIWKMYRTILLPWGEPACPQGMDWELHALPQFNLFAALSTRCQDPLAAYLEQSIVQYLRAWQIMCGGSLVTPGSPNGITRSAINAEQAAYGFLAHKIFGPGAAPLSARAATVQEQGVHDYLYVDFIAHRTLDKFVSFSWKNWVMGLLIPISPGHEESPFFTAPIHDGFVGTFELDSPSAVDAKGKPVKEKPVVVEHERRKTPDGFETTGTLLTHAGRLRQTIRMTSIGDRVVVYEDRVTAVEPVTVTAERGLPFGIENDEISGGKRVVTSREGQTVFDWQHPQPLVQISGSWVNVDGQLGMAVVGKPSIAYVQAKGYTPGISICSDILYGSFSDQPRHFHSGDEVAHRLAIFAVEVTPDQTKALANSCEIETTGAEQVLHFKAPGATRTEIKLLSISQSLPREPIASSRKTPGNLQ